MIDKQIHDIMAVLASIKDNDIILSSGFSDAGAPVNLLESLIHTDLRNLTIVSNNAGRSDCGLAALIKTGKITKIICSYTISGGSCVFPSLYNSTKIHLEVILQGTLSERMRAAGAGIKGFFTPTSVGTNRGKIKRQEIQIISNMF